MTTILIAAFTPIAAVIGGYFTLWIAKRNKSGTTRTSEAAELWAEGKEMRAELRAELRNWRIRSRN